MGGTETFTAMLDSVFVVPPIYDDSYYGYRIHEITEMQVANMGNYAHGNQPAQHMIYLYDWSDEAWKAQKWVREVMDRLYNATPAGYCGDEDNGQTSAWYVFSALGFYPVCPASDEYAIGTPYFKKAVIHLADGKEIAINADNNSSATPYISDMTFNGKSHDSNFLSHSEMVKGAEIDFTMSEKPAK
jgi:predicted alpha-1,2-mannosidase